MQPICDNAKLVLIKSQLKRGEILRTTDVLTLTNGFENTKQ